MKRIVLFLFFGLSHLSVGAQTWETVNHLPLNSAVYQLDVISENKIVVACEYYSLLKWEGSEWNSIGGFTNGFGVPYFVYFSDNDIYATKNDYYSGNTTDQYNYIAHWNGTEWSNANNLNVAKPISKFYVLSPDEMYAAGEFNLPGYNWKPVAKFSDGAWSVLGLGDPQAGSYATYGSLWVNNANDIYTTSGYSDAGVIRIKHWNGTNWEVYYHYQLDQAERLSAPVTGDNGSIYAYGYETGTSESCIAKWNGQYWEVLGNMHDELNLHNFAYNSGITIKHVSDNEIYAVGGKLRDADTNKWKVVKWNGENWSEVGQLNANAAALSLDIYNGYLYVSGSFTEQAPGPKTMVKRFQIGESVAEFEITATANPTEGGAISGAGTLLDGSIANLTAIAATGFELVNWTEDGVVVSEDVTYDFEVDGSRNLVANFTPNLSVSDQSAAKFTIYPNSATDVLQIENPDAEAFVVSIYDLSGKLVHHQVMSGSVSSKIDISSLTAGVYLLKCESETRQNMVKLVKR